MVFGDNCLCVQHQSGFGLEFNALDALRLVNSEQDLLKVACAEDWQKSRYFYGTGSCEVVQIENFNSWIAHFMLQG